LTSTKLLIAFAVLAALFAGSAIGQSPDRNFPSAVTESEISSTIKARDLGDSRLTTHYWVFDGSQGDIFINVVTQNFSGDIDVYQASDLKPLTKIVMYADTGVSETGRVIYMRQPGRLLLRVQGRTPNDDPASYKIKFAGSFVALAPRKEEAPPTVGDSESTGIKVNSVGTIVAVTPKSPPPTNATPAKSSEDQTSASSTDIRRTNEEPPPQPPQPVKRPARQTSSGVKTVLGNKSANETTDRPANPPVTRSTRARASDPATARRERATDPAADYRLVVSFKDGSVLEFSMSDVTRFGYESGKLWVYRKDRTLTSYAIGLIASVTMK